MRQIGQGVHELWSDIQTNRDYNFIYIYAFGFSFGAMDFFLKFHNRQKLRFDCLHFYLFNFTRTGKNWRTTPVEMPLREIFVFDSLINPPNEPGKLSFFRFIFFFFSLKLLYISYHETSCFLSSLSFNLIVRSLGR